MAGYGLFTGSFGLDVVHGRAGVAGLAIDDVADRGGGEHVAGGCGGVGEDALGVAAERAVEQLDDLEHRDLVRRAGKRVAALDPALRAQDARAAHDGEELLEELHRDLAAAGELADRHRPLAAAAAELGQGTEGVRALGRDREHRSRPIVGHRAAPATYPNVASRTARSAADSVGTTRRSANPAPASSRRYSSSVRSRAPRSMSMWTSMRTASGPSRARSGRIASTSSSRACGGIASRQRARMQWASASSQSWMTRESR